MGCLFVLFMVIFAVQKLLSWSRSYLFSFLFPLFCETDQKRYCCNLCQESVLPVFSSQSFIISDLTVRSLVHFEFVVYGVKECSHFVFCAVVQLLSCA